MDAPRERKRTGERELHRAVGIGQGEAQVVDQAQRGALVVDRDRMTDVGVVVVVVEGLGDVRDLDAGHARQEVVDVVVAAQLAVGDDVDAGALLVLEGGLDGDFVDVVEVLAADAALIEVGLQSLQPLGDRVRADDRSRQDVLSATPFVAALRRPRCRCTEASVTGAGRHGQHVRAGAVGERRELTSNPRREPIAASKRPLTQLTTEPSYLPGPRKPFDVLVHVGHEQIVALQHAVRVQQRQRVGEAGRRAVADVHAQVAIGFDDRPQQFATALRARSRTCRARPAGRSARPDGALSQAARQNVHRVADGRKVLGQHFGQQLRAQPQQPRDQVGQLSAWP